MSKILDLAKNFEEKSKEEAKTTEKTVKNAFKQHERSILSALKESERQIKSDIKGHGDKMSWLVLKTWVWVLLSILFAISAAYGVIWLQGEMILNNWQEISKQKQTLEELTDQGGKIQFSRCGDEKRLCAKISLRARKYGENGEYRILEGY